MRFGFSYAVYAVISLVVSTYLLIGHLQHAAKFTNLALCFTFMWAHLALKMIFSLGARPHVPSPSADDATLSVDVVVPIYNEDPALLAAGVRSIAGQTRRPRTLWLIDDGCPEPVLESFEVRTAISDVEKTGTRVEQRRQVNRGKRHAQSVAFSSSDADVFVTVDSDTVLHPDAIAKLLVPLDDPRVMTVGGAACGQNYRRSLFTRVVEMGFVMSFIQGRMAEGFFGSVRVNCGILAAYRGSVVRENLDRYLGQRFLGRPVRAGDDRILTLFAKERGRAEFQPEAVAYSALPVNLNHLVRQRLRWCRSFCWGTLWLLRRPLTSADFWFTFTQVLAMVMYGITSVVSVSGALTGAISPALLLSTLQTATAVGLISHFRYVLLARPGEPLGQRLLTWAVSPLTSLLSWSVLMPLYFVAVFSPRPRAGWGTRRRVEVRLESEPVSQQQNQSHTQPQTQPQTV